MKRMVIGAAGVALLAGCRAAAVAPPAEVVVFKTASYDAVWDAARAVLAEHFPIYTQRKASGDIVTQFDITYGVFEPRRDHTTTARDRWEDTVQTIRRRARADLAKSPDGAVSLKIVVEKERRDRGLEQRSRFTFGASASRYDPTVNALDEALRDPTAPDWMPLGRDAAFENYLIAEIRRRTGE